MEKRLNVPLPKKYLPGLDTKLSVGHVQPPAAKGLLLPRIDLLPSRHNSPVLKGVNRAGEGVVGSGSQIRRDIGGIHKEERWEM